MNEGKFAADFLAANVENIFDIAKKTYQELDEILKVKLRTAYKAYLSETGLKYAKSKSFFIQEEAVDLYSYYVPLAIKNNKIEFTVPFFKDCQAYSKRLVISGSAGSGKTILMKHLFLSCIKSKLFAPVFLELRKLNEKTCSLTDFISETLDEYSFNVSKSFLERAMKEGHFAFFLDGYDEVNTATRKKLINQVSKLSKKYDKCPIIISSRPDDVFNGLNEFASMRVQPLSLDSAVVLIEKLPFDKKIKANFISDMENGIFDKHRSFLSNPLLLSIMLLTYGENAEIPSKLSLFYNQAYEALFQRHDAKKGGYARKRMTDLDIQDFARVFSLFSLQTYEKRLFRMPRTVCLDFIEKSRRKLDKTFMPENYLQDLLSAACLMLEDGLEIAFSHRSFQEYFVALYISSADPRIQRQLIERYWHHVLHDNVMHLLFEINPELVERELILPKLGKLFRSIGVKTKVGITHAAKYIKLVYEKIDVGKDGISGSIPASRMPISRLMMLTDKHVGRYQMPKMEEFFEHHMQLYSKYGSKTNRSETYFTNIMSYRTPLLREILEYEGIFSLKYIQSIYEVYLALRKKHADPEQDINKLLEI